MAKQFPTSAVQEATNLSPKRIKEWIRAGVVVPSGSPSLSPGRGNHHRWSASDVVLVAVLAEFQQAIGAALHALLAIVAVLKQAIDMDSDTAVIDLPCSPQAMAENFSNIRLIVQLAEIRQRICRFLSWY